MHMALLGVHPDVCLQPEVPLLAFARLMHLRIALSAAVLRRRWCMHNGRLHNRAPANANASASPFATSLRPDRVSPADGGTAKSCSPPVPVRVPSPPLQSTAARAIPTAPLPRPDPTG